MKKYDVVILGSGVGGTTAAYALQAAGKKVAIVEEDLWGGACPNRGCDPKKVLLSAVEAQEEAFQLAQKGIMDSPNISWSKLMAFKKTFTDPVPTSMHQGFKEAGIATYSGQASFISQQMIQVNNEEISGDAFIIATGQRPSLLPIDGQEYLQTSTDFLSMETLPRSITFIGAGYVAFELATIANAAGAKVHIIHHNDRPLKGFDEELTQLLVQQLTEKGITFHFNVELTKVTQLEQGYELQEESFSLETDAVIGATGRIPNVENLKLEKAQVAYSNKGIQVNEFLQTSNPRIFACGDILAKKAPKLTPVATFEGAYLAEYLLGNQETKIQYPAIPTICFSSPKLTQVGVLPEMVSDSSVYQVITQEMTSWFTYRRKNEAVAKAKLVFHQNQLVGASVISQQADELINFLTLAIEEKWTKESISQKIMGYPTVASDLASLF